MERMLRQLQEQNASDVLDKPGVRSGTANTNPKGD
jgi:hypothetical protein